MLSSGLVFLLSLASAVAQPPVEDARDYVAPWQYRWGDSPRDAAGKLTYAEAPLTSDGADGWQSLPQTVTPRPFGREGQRFLWLRTRLDGPDVNDPTLQIELLNQLVEAYLDGELVYRFGDFDENGAPSRRSGRCSRPGRVAGEAPGGYSATTAFGSTSAATISVGAIANVQGKFSRTRYAAKPSVVSFGSTLSEM